jgi:hypothetical protein
MPATGVLRIAEGVGLAGNGQCVVAGRARSYKSPPLRKGA